MFTCPARAETKNIQARVRFSNTAQTRAGRMRSLIFVVILALLPLVVLGLVKEMCSPMSTRLSLRCPSPYVILMHSLHTQVDRYCQQPPDERKWTREDPAYLWIYCNLRGTGRCRRWIPRGTFLRINYTCVTLASLRTIDMCSNSQKIAEAPLYIHSPGYLGSGLFRYDWTTNCTCRVSPLGLSDRSVYNFTLSMHDSLAASPDGPSLRWGKRRENHFEDLGEYTKITLINISSHVFLYFKPESTDMGWFWMHVDSTSNVTFNVACNGALGYPIPTLATVEMTSPTSATTTVATTRSVTTSQTVATTTATTPAPSPYPLQTTKSPDSGPNSKLANQGGRPEGVSPPPADGSHDELKVILIVTSTVPWVIILVIVVAVVVIAVRRARKREETTTTINPPIQHVQMGCPAQINGGAQARPISDLNIYAELDKGRRGDVGIAFPNPVYQSLSPPAYP